MTDRAYSSFPLAGTGGIAPRTFPTRAMDILNVDEFYPANVASVGPVHDGSSHVLSAYFGTLGAAQAVYPFVTSLSQQVDYCACKAASNAAFGADGSGHGTANVGLNKALRIPAGRYVFGNDTWLIRNLASGLIFGDGKLATVLTGNYVVLGFDGLWYSEFANFSIQCQTTGADAALDIDGNVPGQPYSTRGVQGNTLRNMLIDGGNSTVAFAMCRQGGGGAQGSENLYLNVHLSGATFACYSQNGFNALANTFLGGNFQGYTQNGIYVTGGTIAVINTGFQSTTGYKQIENNGWDINVGSAGAYEGCIVYGCRTESLRFLNNDGAVSVDIRGCSQNQAVPGWFASRAYGPVAAAYKAIIEGGNLWVATTPGTTGTVKPTFTPASSPISDGSVVWTFTAFNMISNINGSLDRKTLRVTAGEVYGPFQYSAIQKNADYTMGWFDDIVWADATSGPITITLPVAGGTGNVDRGREVTIKKTDQSANAVTIFGPGIEGGASTVSSITIPGGSRGSVTLALGNIIFGGPVAWLIIARV